MKRRPTLSARMPEPRRPIAAATNVMVLRKPMSPAVSCHCSRKNGAIKPTVFCSKTSNMTPMSTRRTMTLWAVVTPIWSRADSTWAAAADVGAES